MSHRSTKGNIITTFYKEDKGSINLESDNSHVQNKAVDSIFCEAD